MSILSIQNCMVQTERGGTGTLTAHERVSEYTVVTISL
jgi:hypothetical protein